VAATAKQRLGDWRVHSSEEIPWCASAGDTAKLAPPKKFPRCGLAGDIGQLAPNTVSPTSSTSFSPFMLALKLNRFIFNFLLTKLIYYEHARASLREGPGGLSADASRIVAIV